MMTSDSLISFLDFFGVLLSLASAVFAARGHILTWPISLGAIFTNGYLWYQQGVWGHTALDIFYFLTVLWGWKAWQQDHKNYKKLPTKHRLALILCIMMFTYPIYILIKQNHGHALFWDSLGTTAAIGAQILTCLRYVEAWPLWLIHDAMNLAISLDRKLPFHTVKQFFYFGIAFYGLINWNDLVKKKKSL